MITKIIKFDLLTAGFPKIFEDKFVRKQPSFLCRTVTVNTVILITGIDIQYRNVAFCIFFFTTKIKYKSMINRNHIIFFNII